MKAIWLIPLVIAARVGVGAWTQARLPSQAEAVELLRRAREAERAVTLAGTVEFERVTPAGIRRGLGRVRRDGRKLRIDYEKGEAAGFGIIDDGARLYHLDTRRRVARRAPWAERHLPQQTPATRNYAARTVGAAQVARRPATVVAMRRRPGARAAKRMWLDRETAFPLRSADYGPDGKPESQSTFTDVDFEAEVPAEVFEVPKDWRVAPGPIAVEGPHETLESLSQAVGFEVIAPAEIPAGFSLQSLAARRHWRWGREMAELTYSDGLEVLTVVEHPRWGRQEVAPEPGPRVGASAPGPVTGPGFGRGRRGGPGAMPGPGPSHQRRFRLRGGPASEGQMPGPAGMRGRGMRGMGHGFGPPDAPVAVVERGPYRAVRKLLPDRVVIVTGDLDTAELLRIADSVRP